ncbi:MAG TPA: single-stranded-DNA-specific exonuclease RecJ [Dehalococcoidia bacterium]|nr:single-stranded-DNA-specific exonuclease RecJ [Dehalococcoidia bacterium]
MNHSRWNVLPPAPFKYLAGAANFSPLIAQLLYNRGLNEPLQLSSFLSADERLSGDPWLLPDMHQAIARVYQALLSGESIAVYGDFDVDGITGTALLVQGLSALGGKVIPYIPHRLTEGYGLKTAALEKLHQQGIGLVISVDCGITALPEVKRARRRGMDIVITDHHTPLETIPPAVAIVDPKRGDSAYPFSQLTGAGVALKLLQALYQSIGREAPLETILDLVALGTVADVAPLLGENRYLVKQGLRLINNAPRLGLREIIASAGLETGNLDAETISWIIAPRLNAAGRLAHAMTSYRLLMTDSPREAQAMARWLEQKNSERQRLTEKAMARAREQVLAREISPLLFAGDREIQVGIAGLVAGRLSEEFYRPTVVIKVGEKISSGSCRSIPEFNIILALNQCHRLFYHFGGHSQAAGFTLPTRNLPRLKEHLSELAAAQLEGIALRPQLDIEAEISLAELAGDTYQSIQQLAPFGAGNPVPAFLSRNVEMLDCRTMGNNSHHLRLKLRQGGTMWDAVGFRMGENIGEVSSRLDVVYNLELDRWRGAENLRLNILDFAPAATSPT